MFVSRDTYSDNKIENVYGVLSKTEFFNALGLDQRGLLTVKTANALFAEECKDERKVLETALKIYQEENYLE